MSFLINPYRFATAGGGEDPYFSSVKLLLHFEGSNGGTTFTDSSSVGNTVTAVGNAQTSTAQYKWGASAYLSDGSGDYLSLPDSSNWDLGLSAQPFTFECWIRYSTFGGLLFGRGGGTSGWNSTSGHQYLFGLGFVGQFYVQWWNGSAFSSVNVASPFATGTWYHVAVCYDGTTLRVFNNGVSIISTSATFAKPSSSTITRVGDAASGATSLNAYMDDLRITQGVARYTADFTPPTAAFPDS